jgi:hypothetical protein
MTALEALPVAPAAISLIVVLQDCFMELNQAIFFDGLINANFFQNR